MDALTAAREYVSRAGPGGTGETDAELLRNVYGEGGKVADAYLADKYRPERTRYVDTFANEVKTLMAARTGQEA